MKNKIHNSRPQARQNFIDMWFDVFVENELYNKNQYHDFCKRVKGLSYLQIERIFRQETSRWNI